MSQQRKDGVGRREFLVMSGAAVALATVGDRLAFGGSTPAVTPPMRLSVGFVANEGAAAHASALSNLNSRTVDALSIGSSDGTFVSAGLRLRISGHGGKFGKASSVQLVQHVDAPGSKEPIDVFVWQSGRYGSPTAYTVRLSERQRVDFSLVLRVPAPPQKVTRRDALTGGVATGDQSVPFILSLQNEAGAVRLRRGTYMIAIDSLLTGATADWSSLHLRDDKGLSVVEGDGSAAAPSKSEFLLITADYDSNESDARKPAHDRQQ
jgi:hypothetical protein